MPPSAPAVARRHLARRASEDPFAEMDADMEKAFRSYMGNLTHWMGFANGATLQWVLKAWRTAGLRRWLAKHVTRSSEGPLYYGGKLATGDPTPNEGDVHPLPWKVLHWSRDRRTSEWFAGIRDGDVGPGSRPDWVGGYLLQAAAPASEIVADPVKLAVLCRRHRESFVARVPDSQVVQLFTEATDVVEGEQEVLTTNRVVGTVVRAARWAP